MRSEEREPPALAMSDAQRVVASSLGLVSLLSALGLVAQRHLRVSGFSRPVSTNIFFRLYEQHEVPYLLLLLVFTTGTSLLVLAVRRHASEVARIDGDNQADIAPLGWASVWITALVVLLAGVGITHFVLHHLLFSMDEFAADFQARIFARGEYAPVVPWPWRSLQDAIAPIFVRFHADTGQWAAVYLPVYAALKSVFVRLGAESWLNPLLSAGSIIALAAVARRLWPNERLRPAVAVALLATSSQFLVTSGTGYAMPAHLLLNLVWLWLYLRGDARSWAVSLVVGVLAMGLHNPFPHTLFVAPFMLRLLRERRWARLASAGVVYVAGAAAWLTYLRFVDPVVAGADQGLLSLFSFPGLAAMVITFLNVSLLMSWHAPVLAILVLVSVAHPRRLDAPLVDLALGVLVTIGFFMFYPSTQGHGWGYRYAHQVLGNLCLLAAAGVPTVISVLGARRTQQWLAVGLATALVIQFPLRLRDTERFVRPFVAGNEYVRSRNAVVVLVRGDSVWYGQDLIRNDPFLRYPIVVRRKRLAASMIAQMKNAFPGRVYELSDSELLQLGMVPMARRQASDAELPVPTR